MFYFKAFQFVSFFSYVKLHGASCPYVWCLVASSSLVGGSGTLQSGIRAHVAAWASMGRENQRQRLNPTQYVGGLSRKLLRCIG